MDDAPFDFIVNHRDKDLQRLVGFRHRTFQDTDLLYFIFFLHCHYTGRIHPGRQSPKNMPVTLESAFTYTLGKDDTDTCHALKGFHQYFFSLEEAPQRTRKHISTPDRGSSCKRLNMYLRWMVRRDRKGVDFGIWKNIRPAQLVCPLDVHVARVARRFGLLTRKQADWASAIELTENLRKWDPKDPVRYDFALFGLGIEEHY